MEIIAAVIIVIVLVKVQNLYDKLNQKDIEILHQEYQIQNLKLQVARLKSLMKG